MNPLGLIPAVFYLRNRTAMLLLSPPVMLFCLAMIWSRVRAGELWLNWLANLVLWSSLLVMALRRKLTLTQDGLHFSDLMTSHWIPWPQVIRLETRRRLAVWTIEGLVAFTAEAKPRDIFVDLRQFSKSWRDGPIGAILRKRRPDLFAALALPRSAA